VSGDLDLIDSKSNTFGLSASSFSDKLIGDLKLNLVVLSFGVIGLVDEIAEDARRTEEEIFLLLNFGTAGAL